MPNGPTLVGRHDVSTRLCDRMIIYPRTHYVRHVSGSVYDVRQGQVGRDLEMPLEC